MRPLSGGGGRGGVQREKIRGFIARPFESFLVFYRLCFDFSSDFNALKNCFFLRDFTFSHSQFQAAELNWRQFST